MHTIVGAYSDGPSGIIVTIAMTTIMQFNIAYENLTVEPHVLNTMEAAEQSHLVITYVWHPRHIHVVVGAGDRMWNVPQKHFIPARARSTMPQASFHPWSVCAS